MSKQKKTEIYDLIVIGSGPGGEGAAIQGVKEGLKVGLVEEHSAVGGNCTHSGTIPSKALRHGAYMITAMRQDKLFASLIHKEQFSYQSLLQRARDIIHKQSSMRLSHYMRNDVELFEGRARFTSPYKLEVYKDKIPIETLEAKHFVIATGSRPTRPSAIDFNHPQVFDSDTILNLTSKPKVVTIYGAGVIGCEYTSIFKSLGLKVNLIHSREKLLSFLDDEIIDALAYHLRDQGVLIKHNEALDRLSFQEGEVISHLKSGKKVSSDIVLFAVGRSGNSEDLGLEELGIEKNLRGNILINESYQTKLPHIYAVGDVVGFPSLASSAYDQGRFATRHILDPKCDNSILKDIPVGIYTSPEISCIGKTERELTAEKVPYEVGQASFRQLARAQITGQTVGMLKILFHAETLEILGIHCFGQDAAEIIHIGQAIMTQKNGGNTIRYFVDITFNYPTMAEAYRVAALNGLNRLCP
jgi:NAD(P) transhydrogenase